MVERGVKDDAELEGDAVINVVVAGVFNNIGEVDSMALDLVDEKVTGVYEVVDVAKDDSRLQNVVVDGDTGVDIVAVNDDTALENAVLSDSVIVVVDVASSDGITVGTTVGKENIRSILEIETFVDGGMVVRGAMKGVDKVLEAVAIDPGIVAMEVRGVMEDVIKVFRAAAVEKGTVALMVRDVTESAVFKVLEVDDIRNDVELNNVAVDTAACS